MNILQVMKKIKNEDRTTDGEFDRIVESFNQQQVSILLSDGGGAVSILLPPATWVKILWYKWSNAPTAFLKTRPLMVFLAYDVIWMLFITI